MMEKRPERELLKELVKNYVDFNTDLYWVEDRTKDDLVEIALDMMSDYNVDLAWIRKRAWENNHNGIDLINEKFWRSYCGGDMVSEWADDQVDIYDSDLWDKVKDYSEFSEEALREFGVKWCGVKERGLAWIFAMGQYQYYSRLWYDVLNWIEKLIEDWDNVDREYKWEWPDVVWPVLITNNKTNEGNTEV